MVSASTKDTPPAKFSPYTTSDHISLERVTLNAVDAAFLSDHSKRALREVVEGGSDLM